jgi:hypothetical protein
VKSKISSDTFFSRIGYRTRKLGALPEAEGEITFMEQCLWTVDDVARFVNHPDRPLRRWALDRLRKRFPTQASEPMITLLDDSDLYIALMASEFLSKTGDKERFGPILMERLQHAAGARFGYLSEALARLDYRKALPLVLARLERARREQETLDTNEIFRITGALGKFGGDQARQTLWEIFNSLSHDHFWAGAVMSDLLEAAQPEDVARLVRVYRSWPASQQGSRQLGSFASAAGAGRLAQEAGYAIKDGFDAALERIVWWQGSLPELSEKCVNGLIRAFERKYKDTFRVLLREARRIVEQLGTAHPREQPGAGLALPTEYRSRRPGPAGHCAGSNRGPAGHPG